ncbi:hypothetical protein Acr_14g0000780 [Actinidia rufa]|uniref:Uncharacterized protein n=1 Tax=Actinidia rufa TaxID=165716 RepID=A0A7J0FP10_9ERIC|nr:hypothetical protein Acr_14g0000780 [Actinidia rufa]
MTEYGRARVGASALLSLRSKPTDSGPELGATVIPRDVRGQKVICTMEFLLTALIPSRSYDDGLLTMPPRHGWVSYLPTDPTVGASRYAPS